jgi:HSP20 family protein
MKEDAMLPTTRRDGTEFPSLSDLVGRWFATEPVLQGWAGTFQPTVDIAETDKEYKVTAECPGMTKDDIKVSLEGNVLTLSGEKEHKEEKKEKESYHSERRYGKFVRTFTLPAKVDCKKIAGTYKDGVLEIVLPKVAEAQPQRIQISAK